MKRILSHTLLAMTVIGIACGDGRPDVLTSYSGPIMGGTPDSGHPAVVAIINTYAGTGCTGTFIDPTTVLTAAHCTLDTDPTHYRVVGGMSIGAAEWIARVKIVAADSRYVPGVPDSGYDIGIVIVDPTAPLEGAGHLPDPLPWLSTLYNEAYVAGVSFVQVGYGWSTNSANDYGVKRLVGLSSDTYDVDRFYFGTATQGACFGDSGGPSIALVDGSTETVTGVLSYVMGACESQIAMRTDYAADFITPYLGMVTPTPTPSATPPLTPTPTPVLADDSPRGGGCGVSL